MRRVVPVALEGVEKEEEGFRGTDFTPIEIEDCFSE